MTDGCTFCLKVTRMEGYFHAICQGEISLAGVLNGWTNLAARCFDEQVDKIICQPHVSGATEFLDVYQFGLSFRDISWPPGMRIAVVCGQEDLARYRLAETMVTNLRGPESAIFTSLDSATAWLFAHS